VELYWAPGWLKEQYHKLDQVATAAAETMQTKVVTSAAEVEGIRDPTAPKGPLGNPHKGKAIRQQNVHQRPVSTTSQPENIQSQLLGNMTGRHPNIMSLPGNIMSAARGLLNHRLAEMA
jgi:hypothetical protein